MKVLLAAALYPPQEGGPATYTKLLMDELPRRGVETSLVLFGAVLGYPPGIRHVLYAWRLFWASQDVDLIYAQDPVSVGVPAALVSLLTRKPLMVKVVGDHVWEQGVQRFGVTASLDDFPRFAWRWHPYMTVLRVLQYMTLSRAATVVVPSKYLQKIVCSWGVAHVTVIYNGIDFTEEPVMPKHRPPGVCVVTAARLVPHKHIAGIIEALVAEPAWSLVVLGDGPERLQLEGLVIEKNMHHRVQFLGSLPHAQALGWYKAADVFVLNSSYEGLSHTLLEALYQGVPVVATEVGGNIEVLENEKNGLLVPVGNTPQLHTALSLVLRDNSLATRLGQLGRERAAQFSIETTLDSLVHTISICVS